MKRYHCLVIVFIIFLIFPVGARSAASKPVTVAELALYQGTDRQQLLEEGAKKEGKLTLYTMGILTQGVQLTVDAFEQRYPFIKVEIWRASTQDIIARVNEEFRMGKSFADVIEGNDMSDAVFIKAGLLQSYQSPALASIEESAITPSPGGGSFSTGFRGSNVSLGYNTKLLSKEQIPKTYEDLLDPKWKGKIALGSVTGPNWLGVILDTLGENFAARLAKQNFAVHTVSGMAVLNMVSNGEYALSTTIYDSHVLESKKKGAPVEWFPMEPVYANLGKISLPKQAVHPHAALLLMDFYLSKESAKIHKNAGYSSTRLDEVGRASYKRFYGPKTLEDAKRWNDTFNKLFLKK